MHDVVGGPDGAGVARGGGAVGGGGGVVARGQGEARGARARSAPLAPGQDPLPRHVEPDRRDGDVELVADRLEGLAPGYALGGAPQLLVRPPDAPVRTACRVKGQIHSTKYVLTMEKLQTFCQSVHCLFTPD